METKKEKQKEECLEHIRAGGFCQKCKYYDKGRCGINECL